MSASNQQARFRSQKRYCETGLPGNTSLLPTSHWPILSGRVKTEDDTWELLSRLLLEGLRDLNLDLAMSVECGTKCFGYDDLINNVFKLITSNSNKPYDEY